MTADHEASWADGHAPFEDEAGLLGLEGVSDDVFEVGEAGRRLAPRVLESTLGVVRRRRRARGAARGPVVVLLCALAFASGRWSRAVPEPAAQAQPGEPAATSAPAPEETEVLAEVTQGPRQEELFARAGDRYAALGAEGLEGAIRCYARALPRAGEEQAPPSGTSHWLMLALAQARALEGEQR